MYSVIPEVANILLQSSAFLR